MDEIKNNDLLNYSQDAQDAQGKFGIFEEMMIAFGPEAVYHFCICNAWRYKNKALQKVNFKHDMERADWYLEKAKQIKKMF